MSVVDSSLDDTDVGPDARADNNKIFYNLDHADDEIVKGDGASSGVDTFKVRIGVVAAAGFKSVSHHALKVVVVPDGEDPLNNLMRNRKITPATVGFGATRVGDGVLFGVDASRTIHQNANAVLSLDLIADGGAGNRRDDGVTAGTVSGRGATIAVEVFATGVTTSLVGA